MVKVGQFTSNSITLNIGAPQGCVLSPLLYSLYTHDCVSSHSSTSIIKFADDTVVLGLINNDDETAYLDEVERLTSWCQDNCLSLNVSKTKELIVDFRKRQQRPYTPLMISGTPVERVSSFKYLGVNISKDLTWTTLHLTHPSVHTWSSGQPTVQRPGSSRGLPVGAGIRTHDLGLPRVSSPTLYPLGQRLPNDFLYSIFFFLI